MSAKKRAEGHPAPSIRRAQVRLEWAWYASIFHGLLLATLGLLRLFQEPPDWSTGLLFLVGAGAVPLLGRATYHGNKLSAHVLLAVAAVPPVWGFFRGWNLTIPLLGLPFAAVYFLGVKGALGLRGRRGRRAVSRTKQAGKPQQGASSRKGTTSSKGGRAGTKGAPATKNVKGGRGPGAGSRAEEGGAEEGGKKARGKKGKGNRSKSDGSKGR